MENEEKIIPTEEVTSPAEIPAEQAETPVEQAEAPVEQAEAPAEQTEAPVEQTEAPAEQTEAPAEQTEAPAEADEPSDADFDQPDEEVPAPKKKTRLLAGALAVLVVIGIILGVLNPFGMGRGKIKEGIYYETTGICPDATLFTVDGSPVSAELYLYLLSSACENFSYYMADGQTFDSVLNETTGETFGDLCRTYALDTAQRYIAIENLAAQYGWTLTEEELSGIEEQVASYQSLYGDFIFQYQGTSPDLLRWLLKIDLYNQRAQTEMSTEGGDLFPTAERIAELRAQTGFIKADHILLASTTNEVDENGSAVMLSEEELAGKRERAELILTQLQTADDPIAKFDELADEWSEDPGRAQYPDGYVLNASSGFIQEFYDGAAALEVGEFSEIIESDFGYHIILRRELSDEELLQNSDYMSLTLSELVEGQTIKYGNAFRDTVETMDLQTFHGSLSTIRQALLADFQASLAAQQSPEDGSAENGGDTAPSEETEG